MIYIVWYAKYVLDDSQSHESIESLKVRQKGCHQQFIEETDVKLIVGKGGMGNNTEEGCKTLAEGNNLDEENKVEFNKKKEEQDQSIRQQIRFIK